MQHTPLLRELDVDEVNESYRSLIDVFKKLAPKVEFLLANSIWYTTQRCSIRGFIDANREFFRAEVKALDLTSPSASSTVLCLWDAW